MSNIGEADLKLLKSIYKDNLDFALAKIKNDYPIQYLIGYVDFYNTKINVNESVLIPRFETELLVDKTVKFLQNKDCKSLIDICTGSGAIAIALKKELEVLVDACDISDAALSLAKVNAQENNVSIDFFKIDILNETINKKYDCIISNPPYVKLGEYVSPGTKYEPKIALYAHNNGLEFYERIVSLAPTILNKKGIMIFEIGASQGEAVKDIVLNYFREAKVTIQKDYNDFDRFVFVET